MMITKHTPIPEVAHWLMPDTARFLDEESSEIQVQCLLALRGWLYKQQTALDEVDLMDLSAMIHQFVTAFVATYKGEPREA